MNNYQWIHLLQQLHTYVGKYEYHLTVDLKPSDTQQLQDFQQCCADLNAKAIVIQLASGETPTQPMLGQFLQGKPEDVLETIKAAAEQIQQHFTLIRIKVEASIHNTNVPQSDRNLAGLPNACYFEHHVKMRLPCTVDLDVLRLDLAQYQGYLSQNAYTRAASPSGLESRFVTQRIWRGNSYAKQQLDHLLNFLQQQQITAEKIIREYNIFDSDAKIDAGWISAAI